MLQSIIPLQTDGRSLEGERSRQIEVHSVQYMHVCNPWDIREVGTSYREWPLNFCHSLLTNLVSCSMSVGHGRRKMHFTKVQFYYLKTVLCIHFFFFFTKTLVYLAMWCLSSEWGALQFRVVLSMVHMNVQDRVHIKS